jgi:hypothetical protein
LGVPRRFFTSLARTCTGCPISKFARSSGNGVIYLSFKYGDAERIEKGRYFNDLNEVSLNVVVNRHPQLDVGQVWTIQDVRPATALYCSAAMIAEAARWRNW